MEKIVPINIKIWQVLFGDEWSGVIFSCLSMFVAGSIATCSNGDGHFGYGHSHTPNDIEVELLLPVPARLLGELHAVPWNDGFFRRRVTAEELI